MASDRHINVTAVSPVSLVLRRPLRFAPPLADHAANPECFSFWWGQLQAVFDMEDPTAFPPFSTLPSDGDLRVLRRFVAKAVDLASSTVLNSAEAAVTIRIADDGKSEEVETNLPPADAIAGFSVVFRQFYGTDAASFTAVSSMMLRYAEAASDESVEKRVPELEKWRRAVGRLRQFSAERLVHEKLAEEGLFPAIPEEEARKYPDLEVPQQAISAYFYGEHIHWGDKAPIVEARARDAFEDATYQLGFLKAATGLAHLYLGYSALIAAAIAHPSSAA